MRRWACAAARVANLGAFAGQRRPVAFLEIGDAVGEGAERERVRAQIHFAVAIADRERRALARADQEILLALEQIDERERPAQAPKRRMNRVVRRFALGEFVLDDEGGNLGIGLGLKRIALGGELLAQRPEILDDPVMDDREPRRGMRMGVVLRGLAVRRPAGVADADRAAERRCGKFRLEVLELAFGAPPVQPAVLERRHAGGIIAAIFEPLQRSDNRARDRPGPENPDNSTHPKVPCPNQAAARQALGPRRGAVDKSSSAKECEWRQGSSRMPELLPAGRPLRRFKRGTVTNHLTRLIHYDWLPPVKSSVSTK